MQRDVSTVYKQICKTMAVECSLSVFYYDLSFKTNTTYTLHVLTKRSIFAHDAHPCRAHNLSRSKFIYFFDHELFSTFPFYRCADVKIARCCAIVLVLCANVHKQTLMVK